MGYIVHVRLALNIRGVLPVLSLGGRVERGKAGHTRFTVQLYGVTVAQRFFLVGGVSAVVVREK